MGWGWGVLFDTTAASFCQQYTQLALVSNDIVNCCMVVRWIQNVPRDGSSFMLQQKPYSTADIL